MEEMLAGRLPLHLVSKDVFSSFKTQLQEEIRYFQWENEKLTLEPRQREFQQAYDQQSEHTIDPPLTNNQEEVVRSRIQAAWASLFFPPPDDCAKEIVYDFLSIDQRTQTLAVLAGSSLGTQEIYGVLREQSEAEERINELGRKISRVEGIDRDGTLAVLREQLKQVQDRRTELDETWREDERRKVALEAQIHSQRAEYERERKKLDDSSPSREIIDRSERVRRVIEAVIPALFPLKVKELASSMTMVYKQLAHKGQVAKIEISDDGSTTILSKSGKPLTFDRSAGENQIFATALIAGLAKVSGVSAPLVVDTPLGRLDSRHRQNILKYWTGTKSRQVILLSQDEEIDADFKKRLRESISKTYLLQHIDVGDGIGRTTAIPDAYFTEREE